jgi:xanthine dehydrogenase accessory factor
VALADLAPRFGLRVIVAAPPAEQAAFADAECRLDGYVLPAEPEGCRFIVVSMQGNGDNAALKAALSAKADYIGFVASRRKAAALRDKLSAEGVPAAAFERLHAPAGLDLGAITPEEIALSILAEIITIRRHGIRNAS